MHSTFYMNHVLSRERIYSKTLPENVIITFEIFSWLLHIWDGLLITWHLSYSLDHMTFETTSWLLHWIWVIWVKLLINWAKRSDNLSWCVFGCFAPQVLDCFPPQILYKESIAFHCVATDVNSGCIFGVF